MRLYAETSALVKLLLQEPDWPVVRLLWDDADEVLASAVGYVEARAALAAAFRDKRVSAARSRVARAALDALWEGLFVIELEPQLVRAAGDTAERLSLRALDAVHLASALAVDGPRLVFASWDDDLRHAASSAGLSVAP